MLEDRRKRRKGKAADRPLGPLTLIQSRLIDTMGRLHDAPDEITYQHSILCQTGLPYRDPGAGARAWDRKQGNAALRISAGDTKGRAASCTSTHLTREGRAARPSRTES